ncbi:hypothetical protein FACS1894190_06660 [Spirochaetia bacterium]|nr:hypothetical protein FACS1894190_06660 [Spirochaetia bacterium]
MKKEILHGDDQCLAARVKQIRTEEGLSQAEFAEVLGLSSPAIISDIERGSRDPSKRVLLGIRAHFGRDLNWLFGGGPDEIKSLQIENDDKAMQLNELRSQITQKVEETSSLNERIDQLLRQNQDKDLKLEKKERQISELKDEITTLLKENSGLKDELLAFMRKQ